MKMEFVFSSYSETARHMETVTVWANDDSSAFGSSGVVTIKVAREGTNDSQAVVLSMDSARKLLAAFQKITL
jgi:hypothetical protein